MIKYKVVGDPSNPAGFSSHIIINSLNEAAKKIGCYDENGKTVVYDCIGSRHGYNADALIVCYELPFNDFIIENCGGKPVLGVSRDNAFFAIEGGYPKDLVDWFPLGVDANAFPVVRKTRDLDKFVVAVNTESLVRGGIELCINAFSKAKLENAKLIIKDRNATSKFGHYVQAMAEHHKIEIQYFNECWNREQIIEFYRGIDVNLYLNRSSTWACPPLEAFSMGIPSVCIGYSGPRDYVMDNINALVPKYRLGLVSDELNSLIGMGCRNFFFPSGYKVQPYWAIADTKDVAEKLELLQQDIGLRIVLSENARLTAEMFSWERSARQLSTVLSKWS